MARASQVACLFCGNLPCTCNGPAKKPKARIKKAAPKTKPQPQAETIESSPKDEVFDLTPQRNRFKEMVDESEPLDQDELEMRTAIQHLYEADMLSATAKNNLREQGLIDRPMNAKVEKRLFDWRRRHAEG